MNKPPSLKIACVLFAFCAATAIAAPAQVLTTLHTFAGYPSDGDGPDAALVQASDGNFYGTTSAGGASQNCGYGNGHYTGCGIVFKITPSGTLTTLYSFCLSGYPSCADGAEPYGGLVQATDGNFYGTAFTGGANDGGGTVFTITPSGTLTTLYSFCSLTNCADGRYPGGLVQATDGNFYGTTSEGGANGPCSLGYGCGTVFRITPSGMLTTLYSFCSQNNCADGYIPWGLVQATDGSFYGVTAYGGANNGNNNDCLFGCGTVFKITPSGTLTTLYSFCSQTGCSDGQWPAGELVQASDGNFYGITSAGGANDIGQCEEFGCGTVFKITPSGTLTTLYSFCSKSGCADGNTPHAGLVQAMDGNFYGTTEEGGANYGGTVFKMTSSGTLTTLYNFCSESGCADGDLPTEALVQGLPGTFYGTTDEGGPSNYGTVFRLTLARECTVCPNP